MNNRSFLVSSAFSHGANDLYWFVLPSVLPMILEQFGLKYGMAGGFLTMFLGVTAVSSMIFGRLADKYPRGPIIGFGFLLASTGLILASLMQGFTGFTVFILLAAIGVSTYHPPIYAAIDERISAGKGRTYGFFELWGALGLFLMFLAYGSLLKMVSWKGLIMITALPGLLAGFYYLTRQGSFQREYVSEPAATFEKKAKEIPLKISGLFFLGSIIRILSITAVVNFIPTFLVKGMGISETYASYTTGLVFLGGMAATPLAGILADRWRPVSLLLLFSGLTGPALFLIGVSNSVWLLPLFLLLLGFCWLGFVPPQNLLLTELGSRFGKGQAFGLMVGLMTLTNAFGPGLFGLLADQVGLKIAVQLFAVPAVVSWVVFVVMAWLYRTFIAGNQVT